MSVTSTSPTSRHRILGCGAEISKTVSERVSARQAAAHAVSPEPSPTTATSTGAGCTRRRHRPEQGVAAAVPRPAAVGHPAVALAVDGQPPAALVRGDGHDARRVLLEEDEGHARGDAVQPPPEAVRARQDRGEDRQHERGGHEDAPVVRAGRRAANTMPRARSSRSVPGVPRCWRLTRPTRRLPATQPAMFAAWSIPTLRPLVAGSSCTARCRIGNDTPIRTVGRKKSSSGRQT